MRQFCRDSVTMGTNMFVIGILLYLLWLPHVDTQA